MANKRIVVFCLALVVFAGIAAAQQPPTLPNINTNNIFNVTSSPYNATTSSTDNATNIQAAINAATVAPAVGGLRGGTVEIPGPGTYMSGPLTIRSNVNLQIDAGATLKFLAESSYPNATATPARPIAGTNFSDVEISGGGTIDGNGSSWWSASSSNPPYMIYLNKIHRVLIQNVTLQNPPKMHLVFKNWMDSITIQNITINTLDPNDHNTDGIDLIGTNCLVQNCFISGGDDNIAIGSDTAGAVAANIVITNCIFGRGHGVSLGGNTLAGVSNLTVVNCIWTNTDFGIRMKSDNAGSSPGAGGVAQNLNYYNLNMTNVGMPILIFSYYNTNYPPQDNITASYASTMPVGTASMPIWRNIVISNLTATNCGESLIWGRIETPVTNFTLINSQFKGTVSEGSSYNFGIYNAYGVQIVDSQIATHSGKKTFTIYNAGVILTNTATTNSAVTIDGLTSTNSLALYNASATMGASDAFGVNPITISGSILSNSTSLTLPATTVVNFALGTNISKVSVNGSLTLNSTLNVTNAAGFTNTTYTLFSYTSGSLTGTPVLGTTPTGYNYNLTNNATAQQVNLVVISTNTSGTAPTITNAPASQSVYVGDNATFTVGATGSTPLNYQWLFNSTNSISGATAASLILTNVQSTNAGGYYVVVTNSAGSASTNASLTVVQPPKFGTTALATGGGVILSVSGGISNGTYYVLDTTNVAMPLTNWTRLATNQFMTSSNFTFTNAIGNNPKLFYRLQLP